MTPKNKWNFDNIPDQSGKIAIVTGANSGTGLAATIALARKGATVIMACRNLEKAGKAKALILSRFPALTSVAIIQLDLADLGSIKTFVENFGKKHQELHILCNNAGVMMTPHQKTADGFELQFGTNHLGHFALTGSLLETLLKTDGSRVVSMSSVAHKFGEMNFDDLNWEKSYNKTAAYGRSKLANLLFAYELQRKLEAAGKKTISNASHPGWSNTNLQQHSPFLKMLNPLLGQKPAMGALPMLYAATAPEAQGGAYYGPGGLGEVKGYPVKVESNRKSRNLEDAKKLWEVSEELTGIKYKF